MKCGSPGDLPRCDVGDDKLDLQVELIEFMEDNAGHKQVLNHQYVTIITNAGSSIILVYSVIGKQLFFTKKARTESN